MSIFYECKKKCDATLDFSFLMQMPFTRMQMQNVHMMHMSPFRDAIFMMQMSHAMVQMQRLSMMVQRTYLPVMRMSPYRDGDAKCFVVQMPFNGHVMMQMLLVGMSWCKCPLGACHDANVDLWVCHDANVHEGMPWCKCSCRYVMM